VREGDGGLLVGLLPLMIERRRGLGRLLFVGTGPTSHLDAVVREGWEDLVSEAAARALRRMEGWHVADMQELSPKAAAWALLERWSGRKTSVWQSQHPVIDATGGWIEMLKSRSKRLRNNARRTLRRAEEDELRCELVDTGETREAARRLAAISKDQWRGNPLTGSEHWTPRFESHLETAVCRMATCGRGGVAEWRRSGDVMVSEFLVFGPCYVGAYMVGIDRRAFSRYQVSALTAHMEVCVARRWDAPHVSLGRGQEAYKLQWSSELVPNHRLILGRDALPWSLYAGYHVLRSAVKRYATSPNSPRWIGNIPSSYKVVRHEASRYMRRIGPRKKG
jgi:hypothetical protein